jgi:hypothetical protein
MCYSTNIANYFSTRVGYCDTLREDQRTFVGLIIVTVFSKIRIEAEEAVILLKETNFTVRCALSLKKRGAASMINRKTRVLSMRDLLYISFVTISRCTYFPKIRSMC